MQAELRAGRGGRQAPVAELLSQCVLAPVKDRVDEIGQQLLGQLLSGWGLMRELAMLRSVFLLACPASSAWADSLLAPLRRGLRLEQLGDSAAEALLEVSAFTKQPVPSPARALLPAVLQRTQPQCTTDH